ncbi:hypothetical protein IAR55_003037 [Kwoniella newhampshirensis]|uniref:Uncharacterized protein n=1 Tax=Kwoniella newhampshirensis TaxID=1651941 RepID=A0AAW0Z0L2_9TREE
MSDANFVDNQADIAETNIDASKEDRIAEESEATGKISQGMSSTSLATLTIPDEVAGLKDSLSEGEALNDSEGYTRSSNQDAKPMQAEEEVDAAVDNLE